MNTAIICLNLLGIIGHVNEDIKALLHYYDFLLPVASLSLILLLIAGIDKAINVKASLEYNPVFWAGWAICFIAMFISSLIYPTKDIYFLWCILSLSIFPMIMMTWNDQIKISKLFTLIAHHMVIASYLFVLINLLSVAFITNTYYTEGIGHEYLGIAPNPNSNGLIVLPFFTSALFLTITRRKNKAYYICSLFISIMFTLISNTRTAELAMILEVMIALLLVVRHKEAFLRTRITKKTISTIVVAIIVSIAIGCCLMYLDRVDLKVYAEGEIEESYADIYGHENLVRINQLSNGRLILWKAYLKIVSFNGHGNPDGPLFEDYDYSRWAHNNALDIWYASGFIAFAGYITWLLAACGFVIISLVKRKGFRKEHLLTILAFVGYFVEAMLEITIYPMQTGIVLLCFLTLMPIAFKGSDVVNSTEYPRKPTYLYGGRHYK